MKENGRTEQKEEKGEMKREERKERIGGET